MTKYAKIFLIFLTCLVSDFAIAQTTQLGRTPDVIYPALHYPAGSAQVNLIHEAVRILSNDSNSRFETASAVANSAVTTFDHGFGVAFTELRVLIYTGTHPNLTRVTNPTASGWTIAATSGFLKTKIDVTAPSSGGPHTFAVLITQGKGSEILDDLDDVDVTTTAPEDGQALVYTSTGTKWVPGASGDSSFKCQSVTDPNLVLKNGYMILDSGMELQIATDLTVNLDTVLGSNPVNATAYYLYIDTESLPSATLLTSGRQVKVVSAASNFSLQTTLPDAVNQVRYIPLCVIKSATTGTVWSGSGSAFATLASRRHGRPAVAVSPTVYELTKQTVGSVGSSAQVMAGHVLATASFPAYTTETSWYNLASAVTDGSGNARSLTNNATTPFTATNILGTATSAAALNGTTQYFSTTSSFFNPGNGVSFSVGGWYKATDWTPAGQQTLFFNQASSSDRGFGVTVETTGNLQVFATNSAGAYDLNFQIANPGFTDATWHHIVFSYNFTNTLVTVYVDGTPVGTGVLANQRSITSSTMTFGAVNATPASFFAGSVEDVFFTTDTLTANDVRRLYAYRIDHNKNVAVENQSFSASYYDSAEGLVNEFMNDFLVAKTANSAWVDFGLGATDKVSLRMQNLGLAANVIPISTFTTGKLSAAPTLPLTHGLGVRPKDFYVLIEGASESSKDDKRYDLCSASDTQINCDLSSLTIDSSHKIEIVASAAPIAISVPLASATEVGSVGIGTQTIAGAKTLTGLLTASAGIKGTVTNDDATAGNYGENIDVNPGGAVTVGASNTFVNVVSQSLAAGDYEIGGTLVLNDAATGKVSMTGAISTNSAALGATNRGILQVSITDTTSVANGYFPLPTRRISLATTSTIYLVARLTYSLANSTTWSTESVMHIRRIR